MDDNFFIRYSRIGRESLRLRRKLQDIRAGMVSRCYRESDVNFARYGAAGLTVCKEWLADSAAFIRWAMSNGYRHGLEIDRKDNTIGYSPDNCRWVPKRINTANRRRFSSKRSSQFKGVFHVAGNAKPWRVIVQRQHERVNVGYFATELEAAKAYDSKARELFGTECCSFNFPPAPPSPRVAKLQIERIV